MVLDFLINTFSKLRYLIYFLSKGDYTYWPICDIYENLS